MTAVVEIETLELEGLSPEEGRRAAKVFEGELARLLERYGLPEGRDATDLEALDLGALPQTAATPEGLGRELAKALFGELWR